MDSKKKKKKTIGFINKTRTLHMHHACWYISLPIFAQLYNVKMPNFAVYGVRKLATTKFYFSF